MADDKFRSLPTVASLDAVVRRLAARLVNLEGEFNGDNPDGQLAKLWESVEELNLRILFLMNTLQVTQTLSLIADHSGKVPTRKMTALEAYMQHGGREKLIAGLEAQEKERAAAQAAQANDGGMKVEVYEGLQAEGQADAASANGSANKAADDDPGPSTYVENPSKFDKQ